jgi:Ni,Fe-hydrogenase maturation factor
MPALVIAIGNPLRHDDGVAHHVARLLGDIETRSVFQLTPELAEEMALYDPVVFVDADVNTQQVQMEPVASALAPSPLTHVLRPAEIVALAGALFGFTGHAYTCRIPVSDLSEGEGLSPDTMRLAEQAALSISNASSAGQGTTR